VENSVPAEGADAVISHHQTSDAVVITIAGEVDTLDADDLVECVRECATACDNDLVLDFRDVSFVSVSVLGRLVAVREWLVTQGRTMRLCVPAGGVGRYFKLVGL